MGNGYGFKLILSSWRPSGQAAWRRQVGGLAAWRRQVGGPAA